MIKCLIGSQNYGLDGPDSDKDYYIYRIPTFKDIYNKKSLVDECYYKNGINFYKDIRSLSNMIHKASFNQLEILYSKEVLVEPSCENLWNWMVSNRELIARANIKRLKSSTMGEMNRRINDLKNGKYTQGTKHLFEKYGYDTKNAMHVFRLYVTFYNFIISGITLEMAFDMTFKMSVYDIVKNKNYSLSDIRNGMVSKEECLRQLSLYANNLAAYKCDIGKNKILVTELEDRIMQVVKELC